MVPGVDEAIDGASEKSAREHAELARRFAPEQSGNLKAAIYAAKVPGRLGPAWKVAVDQGDGPTGRDAFYGFWVEFATINTPAQPFFFPSFRLVKRRHKGRVTRAINKEVKRIART